MVDGANLLTTGDADYPNEGIVSSYVDDLYWALLSPINVIDFVQKSGSDYGYRLNMDKSIYLMARCEYPLQMRS